MPPPQRHLIDIESLSDERIRSILDHTRDLAADPGCRDGALRGRTAINVFYEDSTRTRVSFELAARRLGMELINVSAIGSSVAKGESLLDTFLTLQAMGPDVIVLRHPDDGAPAVLEPRATDVALVNGGDGCRAHPTQALLDAATILQHCPRLDDLVVTIAGDILHSRVARSNYALLTRLGVGELRIAAPAALMPAAGFDKARRINDFDQALDGADVVMMLRVQRERFPGNEAPHAAPWHASWGLTPERLARAAPGALVMHPGPMNRGVEIASLVADGERSLILDQVRMGVLTRMAIFLDVFAES